MRCGYGVVFRKNKRHRASSRKLRDDGGCEKSSNVNESQREREGRETVSSISTVDTLDTISPNNLKSDLQQRWCLIIYRVLTCGFFIDK